MKGSLVNSFCIMNSRPETEIYPVTFRKKIFALSELDKLQKVLLAPTTNSIKTYFSDLSVRNWVDATFVCWVGGLFQAFKLGFWPVSQ